MFPVPTNNDFKGTHAISLDQETGELRLGVWISREDKTVHYPILFINEEFSKEELERAKVAINKREAELKENG